MMNYKIIDLETDKEITEEELAIKLYEEGHNIVYCDIEGISKSLKTGDYDLLDECGNAVWLDPKRFKVIEED